MDPVIVMVGRTHEGVYDLEIMPDISASNLAEAISEALGWQETFDIEVNGRRLLPDQTLAEVAAWDGTHLTFISLSRPTPAQNLPGQSVNLVSASTNRSKGSRALQVPTKDVPASGSSTRILKTPQQDPVGHPADSSRRSLKIPDQDAQVNSPQSPSKSPVVGWKFSTPTKTNEEQDNQDPDTKS